MSFIFQSKKDIAPLLEGFVDIHCHILPGIDDGAKNTDDTRAMLSKYKELGIKKIIGTPHILKGSYPNTQKTISEAFEKAKLELEKSNTPNPIATAAAEHMLDEGFEEMLKNKEVLPLKDNYLLVEMSYFQKPINFSELIFEIKHNGYTPVLAHPERYSFIKTTAEYEEIKKLGCLLQLNLLSLSKHYGQHVQKKAFNLLKEGLYNFAGTDAHHDKHLSKIKQIRVSKKQIKALKQITSHTIKVFD